ncbi:MAG: hypothetical protein ACI8YI_000410 [Paracoccaceae bacterium]|jgi:hypothetical protein
MRADVIFALLLILAGCGRPLSTGEAAFANTLFGPELKTETIRVAPFSALTSITQRRPARPREACRELIWPAPKVTTGTVETFTAAFVTFNRLNIAKQLYAPDYLSEYPDKISLPAAMLIGHELTHVWQWQNRDRTDYHPLKAAAEHAPGTDPYLLDFGTETDFLDFPFEQQGAIVEEYICCSSLDPNGARTKRLHALLRSTMPVSTIDDLPTTDVILPWKWAKTAGICSA